MKKGFIQHYYKLITLLIVLSTVPVIITGSLSFWKSAEAIQEYSRQEKIQNVYQIQTNVDQVLKHVDLSITHFVRSSQTQQLLRQEMSGQVFNSYHNVRRQLNHLQTLDTGIEDIVLLSFEEEWLINNDGLSHLNENEYKNMYDYYMSLPATSWTLEEYENIVMNTAVKHSCSHYINLVKKLPIISSEKTGLISVLIPSCKLIEIMGEKVDSESFIILDDSNHIISHSNPGYIGSNFTPSESLVSKIDSEAKMGQFNEKISDTEYMVTYRNSDYNNWTYVSFVKVRDLHQKSSSIGWLTLTICSILLVFSLLFAFIGSRAIYKPIRNLQEFIRHSFQDKNQQLEPSKTDEFKLIQTHIKQILHKNNELENRMQSQLTQLKQLLVIRLLQGKVNKNEIPVKLASFNYNQEWKQLTIFAIQIDSFEHSKFTKNDEDLLLFAINNVIQDLIATEIRLAPVVINDTQATIFLTNYDDHDTYLQQINQHAESIQKEIKKLYQIPVSIGISHSFEEFSDAKKAFKESKEALKYRLKLGTESIIFYANLDRNYQYTTSYPSNIKNKLFDAIKLADRVKIDQELNKFFDYLYENEIHHNQYDIIIARFLHDLIELQQLLGVELPELENRPIMMELQEVKTFTSMKDWFNENIIKPLMEKVEERTDSQYKKLSDKMIHIIQKDFDKDISLESIGAQLHYNPNYLSSIFQKEMKRSFSEYLLMYRINMAKDWLVDTDLSVKEIAQRLQYNNSQNFIRSFRKIEGTTPGKYRTQNKK